MAAVITQVEIATNFGAGGAGTAPLDGLVQVDFDRVDQDYSVDEGGDEGVVKARRLIVLRYEPPANTPNLDYYANIGQTLAVKRLSTGYVYKPILKQVIESWENRSGTQTLVLTLFLVVPPRLLNLEA